MINIVIPPGPGRVIILSPGELQSISEYLSYSRFIFDLPVGNPIDEIFTHIDWLFRSILQQPLSGSYYACESRKVMEISMIKSIIDLHYYAVGIGPSVVEQLREWSPVSRLSVLKSRLNKLERSEEFENFIRFLRFPDNRLISPHTSSQYNEFLRIPWNDRFSFFTNNTDIPKWNKKAAEVLELLAANRHTKASVVVRLLGVKGVLE